MWNTVSDMWYGKRLDGYTAGGTQYTYYTKIYCFLLIVELHAEVFYAECSLLEALLTFLQVSTIILINL